MTIILALVILCRSTINILMLVPVFIRDFEQWSEWSAKSSVNFKTLPPGDSFKVKAKFANAILDNTAIYLVYDS
jgi:hypothetical protein